MVRRPARLLRSRRLWPSHMDSRAIAQEILVDRHGMAEANGAAVAAWDRARRGHGIARDRPCRAPRWRAAALDRRLQRLAASRAAAGGRADLRGARRRAGVPRLPLEAPGGWIRRRARDVGARDRVRPRA